MRVRNVPTGRGVYDEPGRPFAYYRGEILIGDPGGFHGDLLATPAHDWQYGYLDDDAMIFDLYVIYEDGSPDQPKPALARWLKERGYERLMTGEQWREALA